MFKGMGWQKFRFGLKKRISLYDRLSSFLDASIPIVDAIDTIAARYAKNSDARANVLGNWSQGMAAGMRFSDAVKPWVPASEHMLIAAGESGKGLVVGLMEASHLSKASAKAKATIIGGSIKPLVLFLLLFLLFVGVRLKMVPIMLELLPLEKWPSGGKMLYALSDFITNDLWVFIILFIVLGIVIAKTISRWTGPVRDKFDKLPPWSVYRIYQASSFLVGLSCLMEAGIPLHDALSVMYDNGSPWLRVHLGRMLSSLQRMGENHGAALNTGMLDSETAGDVEDYSKLQNFTEAIHTIGDDSLQRSVGRIQTVMDGLGYAIMGMVAGVTAWLYTAFIFLTLAVSESASNLH